MKLPTLLAFLGALPFPAKSTRVSERKKPLTALFLALHESRRRQAERDIQRHQHLLDRHARPQAQQQPAAYAGDTTSQGSRADAELRSVFLP